MKLLKPDFWKDNNLISFLIRPITLITRLVILLKKSQNSFESDIPSICVGNIYLGGTGKTQLVIKINEILKKKYKIFVIKKKYGNQIDEQRLLNKKTNLILPMNRIEGLKTIPKSNKNIAVFDDGLQDKSIKYDISIVCFSSISGVGNEKLLPAGPLREDLSELKSYNAAFINGKKNKFLVKKIKKFNQNIKIFYGRYILKNKKEFSSKSNYLAFCGIGTPENFFNLLKENKINVKKKLIFPDHFNYKNIDIKKINNLAKKNNLKIVTTEKDYMKIKKFKNLKVKFTIIDMIIEKNSIFKKFLTNYL